MAQQYLICANDYLQTAFFCGDVRECSKVLGITINTFYSSMSHKINIHGFFHIEKVDLPKENTNGPF